MQAIMSITPNALQHVIHIIEQRGHGIGLRIAVKQTGCSGYMYQPEVVDTKKDEDIEILIDEKISLFIDPKAVELIKGTTIDYVKKQFGMEQMVFHNPNAEGLCGCGESFKLKSDHE